MTSVVDGLAAAVAVNDVEKAVVKATNHKVGPPKAKHLRYLLSYSQGWGANYQELFRYFRQRIREKDWVVAFKVLIVLHELIREGSERFCGALANETAVLNLHNFRDKSSGSQGAQQSVNIRSYAQYLEERVGAMRELGFDFFRDSKNTSARLRSERVSPVFLNELSSIHRLVQALLGCKFYLDDIDNPVTFECFRLLLKDLLKIYHILNEGVINILQQFFDLPKSLARDCLGTYKNFVKQSEEVNRFLTIAKSLSGSLGIDPPELRLAPSSLANDLEVYLNNPNSESFANNSSATSMRVNSPLPQSGTQPTKQSQFFQLHASDGFVPTSKPTLPSVEASPAALVIEPPKRQTNPTSRRREASSPNKPMTSPPPQNLIDPFDDFLNDNIKVATPNSVTSQQANSTPFGAPGMGGFGGSAGISQQRGTTSFNTFAAPSTNPFGPSSTTVDPFRATGTSSFGDNFNTGSGSRTPSNMPVDPFVQSQQASFVQPHTSQQSFGPSNTGNLIDPFASIQPFPTQNEDSYSRMKADVLRAQNSSANGMVPYGMTPQQQQLFLAGGISTVGGYAPSQQAPSSMHFQQQSANPFAAPQQRPTSMWG